MLSVSNLPSPDLVVMGFMLEVGALANVIAQALRLGVNYRDLMLSKELCLISGFLHFYAFLCTVLGSWWHFYAFYALFIYFYALFMHFYALFMHFCAFLCIIPKWFWTITCAIWLRLQFRGRGSAQNFGAHLLFFHAPGWILGPRVRFSGLGVDIPARGQFWLVLGSQKR